MFGFTARLLKKAGTRDAILRSRSEHWRRVKKGKLVHVPAGSMTPPEIIKVENGDRLAMGQEALIAYLNGKIDVLAATYVPGLPVSCWIDFLGGDSVIGFKHIVFKRDALRARFTQLFPDKPNPLPTGQEALDAIPDILANCKNPKTRPNGNKVVEWDGWLLILGNEAPRCVVSLYNISPVCKKAYEDVVAIDPKYAEKY